MVNEQTYTFIDRGEREVTLRPEMTPTVARMVAGKRRELHFPCVGILSQISFATNAHNGDVCVNTGN